MTTTTTPIVDRTAGETRKQTAKAALQQLCTERDQILTRQRTAPQEVQRLNDDIARATRSGEADTLVELRATRRAAEDSARDLPSVRARVDRDIELAEAELHAAEVMCSAELFNAIRAQQVALLEAITKATALIVSALADKEKLGHQQQKILASVCAGPVDKNPHILGAELTHSIAARLLRQPAAPLRELDWSTWEMTTQGDLVK